MTTPDIALLVSTFERPEHLRRSLLSIALQQGVAGRFEVVVTDDGSTDRTAEVVEAFSRDVDFPVRFTTHPHDGFRLSQCRNEGVAASCAVPVVSRWRLRVAAGSCAGPSGAPAAGLCDGWRLRRLEQEASARVDERVLRSGEYRDWVAPGEKRRLAKLYRSALLYTAIRHPNKPKLIGNNVGIWRSDYERVNGYDENFHGWGCEDDDLRLRLRRAGAADSLDSAAYQHLSSLASDPCDAAGAVRATD